MKATRTIASVSLAAILVFTSVPMANASDDSDGESVVATASELESETQDDETYISEEDPDTTETDSSASDEADFSDETDSSASDESDFSDEADSSDEASSSDEADPQPANPEFAAAERIVPTFDDEILIIGGLDRYSTMERQVRAAFPQGAEGAIVVTGENWPDGLAVSGLAGALNYPVVYISSTSSGLSGLDLLADLSVRNVIVVGGTSSISNSLYAQISAISGVENIMRVSGSDRTETSAAIYEFGAANLLWDSDQAIIVSGGNFADGLSAASYAYATGTPVLVTTGNSISQSLADAASDASPSDVLIVGGTSSVTESQADAISDATPTSEITRLSGSDRYATSYTFASWTVANSGGAITWEHVAFASGSNAYDSIAGSSLQGILGAPTVLAGSVSGFEGVPARIASASPSAFSFFGGTNSLTLSIRRDILDAFGIGSSHGAEISTQGIYRDYDSTTRSYYALADLTRYSSINGDTATGTISSGQTFTASRYDAGGAWLTVQVNGTTAYVPRAYTIELPTKDPWTSMWFAGFLGSYATVYAAPSTEAPVIGGYSAGYHLAYCHYDAAGEWLQVSYNGTTGYVQNGLFKTSVWLQDRLERIVASVAPSGSDTDRLYNLYRYVGLDGGFSYIRGAYGGYSGWEYDFATNMLNNWGGNCYCFAALMALLGQTAGYNVQAVCGSVNARGGGTTPHSWCEYQGYIIDPQGLQSYPSYNFFMRSYGNAPLTYYK